MGGSGGSGRAMAAFERKASGGMFLTEEHRRALESALEEKRQEEERMGELGQSPASCKVATSPGSKPSVLDIDPWESGALLFMKRRDSGTHVEEVLDKGLKKKPSLVLRDASPTDQGRHGHHREASGARAREKKRSLRSRDFWLGIVPQPRGEARPYLDKQDPNYDSGEDEKGEAFEVYDVGGGGNARDGAGADAMFKAHVSEDLREYLASGDMVDLKLCLEDLGQPDRHALFVKRAVLLAMERDQREREMVSKLLSFLYPHTINAHQMQAGFSLLVASTEDILVDHPSAVETLSLFLARAVVDDILPRSFQPAREGEGGGGQAEAAVMASFEGHIHSRHAGERLLRCWGAGAGKELGPTKQSIASLLEEFASAGDADEASRCLRALKVPFFHHEVVKQAIRFMLVQPASAAKIMGLLKHLSATGVISDSQMATGFARTEQQLGDLELDVPNARGEFREIAAQAVRLGMLDPSPGGSREPAEQADEGFAAFKRAAYDSLVEYFNSGDLPELMRFLEDPSRARHQGWFVKRAISLAMDRKPKHKEMVSVMLSSMHNCHILTKPRIEEGFNLLLAALDDLLLDVPDATAQLALFLARCTVDEALPPSFTQECISASAPRSSTLECLTCAAQTLAARHAAERLDRCWGLGAKEPTAREVKQGMRTILEEFVAGADGAEAGKCLRDLSAPFFHHEFVKMTLVRALESRGSKQPQQEAKLLGLLRDLAGSGLLTDNQTAAGFRRAKAGIEDLALDVPDAGAKLGEITKQAQTQGWLAQEAN